jgi:hypothetical protein
MELFGVGPLELLFFLLLVLMIYNPKDIVAVAKKLARALRSLYRSEGYRMVKHASDELRKLPDVLAREAELDHLKQIGKELEQDMQKSVNFEPVRFDQDGEAAGAPVDLALPPRL